uniref:Uncharacterized protein n=1 Tax=Oryza glumipatula TaxID=40148 RepID=A0A0E0BIA4_9ORYZ
MAAAVTGGGGGGFRRWLRGGWSQRRLPSFLPDPVEAEPFRIRHPGKVNGKRPKILAQYSRNRFPSLLMLMLGGATHYTQLVDLHEWSCQHHNDNQIGVQDKMASIGAALSGLKNSSFTTMGAEKLPDQMHDLKIRDDNEVQVTNINGKGAETGHIIVTTTGGRNGQPKLTKCKSAWEDMLNTEHAELFAIARGVAPRSPF